jgi:hypothetical protein
MSKDLEIGTDAGDVEFEEEVLSVLERFVDSKVEISLARFPRETPGGSLTTEIVDESGVVKVVIYCEGSLEDLKLEVISSGNAFDFYKIQSN